MKYPVRHLITCFQHQNFQERIKTLAVITETGSTLYNFICAHFRSQQDGLGFRESHTAAFVITPDVMFPASYVFMIGLPQLASKRPITIFSSRSADLYTLLVRASSDSCGSYSLLAIGD